MCGSYACLFIYFICVPVRRLIESGRQEETYPLRRTCECSSRQDVSFVIFGKILEITTCVVRKWAYRTIFKEINHPHE